MVDSHLKSNSPSWEGIWKPFMGSCHRCSDIFIQNYWFGLVKGLGFGFRVWGEVLERKGGICVGECGAQA